MHVLTALFFSSPSALQPEPRKALLRPLSPTSLSLPLIHLFLWLSVSPPSISSTLYLPFISSLFPPLPSSPPSQALPHKLPLSKRQPPFTRPVRIVLIHSLQQAQREFLANLAEILAQGLGVVAIARRLERLVEREPGVAGDREGGVEGGVEEGLYALALNEDCRP